MIRSRPVGIDPEAAEQPTRECVMEQPVERQRLLEHCLVARHVRRHLVHRPLTQHEIPDVAGAVRNREDEQDGSCRRRHWHEKAAGEPATAGATGRRIRHPRVLGKVAIPRAAPVAPAGATAGAEKQASHRPTAGSRDLGPRSKRRIPTDKESARFNRLQSEMASRVLLSAPCLPSGAISCRRHLAGHTRQRRHVGQDAEPRYPRAPLGP